MTKLELPAPLDVTRARSSQPSRSSVEDFESAPTREYFLPADTGEILDDDLAENV